MVGVKEWDYKSEIPVEEVEERGEETEAPVVIAVQA